jgi:hypothetical protein
MREFDDSAPLADVPGGLLPEGERLIWQGAPRWQAFAIRVMHIRKVAAYFAILMVWRFAADLSDGLTVMDGLVSAAWIVPLAAIALALIAGYAWGVQRSTVYTVTSERLIFRLGVALPMTVTVPMGMVESVDVKRNADGTGDVAVAVSPKARLSYAVLWPHARPWRFSRPEASLRAIADVDGVAERLTAALQAQTQSKAIHTVASTHPVAPTERPSEHERETHGPLASATG